LYKGRIDSGNLPQVVWVDFVTGCGMMINTSIFKRIGLFNSQYFMYGEDVEFCWKAQQAGYKIGCATKGLIWHKSSVSAKKDMSKSRYLKTRNQIAFFRENSKKIQLVIMFTFSVIQLFRILTLSLFHKQLGLVRPTCVGFLDGWFQLGNQNHKL
jgi:GT2 family glycosyltransferase